MSYPPPIYDGAEGEVTAWARTADSTPEIVYPNGNRVRYLARGDGAASMLLHFAPGAPREGYFEGLARGLDTLTHAELDAFMAEHDNLWVE